MEALDYVVEQIKKIASKYKIEKVVYLVPVLEETIQG